MGEEMSIGRKIKCYLIGYGVAIPFTKLAHRTNLVWAISIATWAIQVLTEDIHEGRVWTTRLRFWEPTP